MNLLRRCLLLNLLALVLSCTACASTEPVPEPLSAFPAMQLSIVTQGAKQIEIKGWLADTDAHREQGLMFVRELPEHTGMLFVFDNPQPIAMWMKNTLIPLDMLFINTEGRIESIIANATPLSLKILKSKGPVLGVLEIAGGSAARLGIQAGALVKHPAFAALGGSR